MLNAPFRAAVAALILGVIAGAALAADGWTKLDDAAIRQALTERRIDYPDGSWQTFDENGGTDYNAGKLSEGQWEVKDGKYCSVWPPSDSWACYGVEMGADRRSVRFIAADGSITAGVYGD